MMKKLSKLALLAAATALLLAVFPACSDDDDGDVGVTVTPTLDKPIALKAGESDTYTVTFTVTGDTFKQSPVTEPVKLVDKNNKVTIEHLTMVADSFTATSVKYSFKVTAKSDATVGSGKIGVTADASVFTLGNPYTGELDYTIKSDSALVDGLPVLWKISDYFSELGNVPNGENAASLSSLGHTDGKDCGIVKIGANVKVRSDGDGKSNTITEGITGYCQLSNGKAGSLLLTVPAGATKITLGAKNEKKSLAIYDSNYTALKAFTDDVGINSAGKSDYANYVYEYAFTEETQIYITSPGGTTNFKAIKVE